MNEPIDLVYELHQLTENGINHNIRRIEQLISENIKEPTQWQLTCYEGLERYGYNFYNKWSHTKGISFEQIQIINGALDFSDYWKDFKPYIRNKNKSIE